MSGLRHPAIIAQGVSIHAVRRGSGPVAAATAHRRAGEGTGGALRSDSGSDTTGGARAGTRGGASPVRRQLRPRQLARRVEGRAAA
eukprot:900596-Alexandrium_andersonii.AAC.1